MTLSLPLIVALVIIALLTAGSMAVRSVSRIWLRHWAADSFADRRRPSRIWSGRIVC